VNNLPAYVAGEAVIPVANHHQLIGLLIGTNVGPVIVPWASLATLIWAEHCRHAGVTINWRRFMVTGALMAAGALTAAVAVLIAMPLHDHGGSISLPFLDTSGLVQAARLKQQGRRFPLFIFDILTSTRPSSRVRVSWSHLPSEPIPSAPIGVMSFHRPLDLLRGSR